MVSMTAPSGPGGPLGLPGHLDGHDEALGFMRRLDLAKLLQPELVNELTTVEVNLTRAVSSVR